MEEERALVSFRSRKPQTEAELGLRWRPGLWTGGHRSLSLPLDWQMGDAGGQGRGCLGHEQAQAPHSLTRQGRVCPSVSPEPSGQSPSSLHQALPETELGGRVRERTATPTERSMQKGRAEGRWREEGGDDWVTWRSGQPHNG